MRLGVATTLIVKGRNTGAVRRTPVKVLAHHGARYLVSPRGEAEWVKNLRASGEGHLRRWRSEKPFRAVELPEAERRPIIEEYKRRYGAIPFIGEQFRSRPDPADHPVFRIGPAQSP
ncbi:MAG TPA: nitroreductase/quinone reductase family protein [Actinomycetota bacterium]|nr:nitroreductase/quinone reductase family protein [Actinomycetota bacterium]